MTQIFVHVCHGLHAASAHHEHVVPSWTDSVTCDSERTLRYILEHIRSTMHFFTAVCRDRHGAVGRLLAARHLSAIGLAIEIVPPW